MPAGGGRAPLPGGSGHRPAGRLRTGLRGARWTGTAQRGLTLAARKSQEARSELSRGVHSPKRARGGAPKGERARSARGGWQHSFRAARAASADAASGLCAFWRSASLHYFLGGRWTGFLSVAWAKLGCKAAPRERDCVVSLPREAVGRDGEHRRCEPGWGSRIEEPPPVADASRRRS